MASILTNPYSFNGVISTDKTVKQNLDTLASAAGCYMTFDTSTGKWCVIINRAGSSVKSFNDSNIIGSINITLTDMNSLYNKVSVSFPHSELSDQRDTIIYEIPANERFQNEQDNMLSIQYDIINNPIQCSNLAAVELKQNRLDKVIQFQTDYSSLGLKAGDIIDITNTMYNFNQKKFRITTIEEQDNDDGNILLSITALEYSDAVYNHNLSRYGVTTTNGIIARNNNNTLTYIDAQSVGNQLTAIGVPQVETGSTGASAALLFSIWNQWILAGCPTELANIEHVLSFPVSITRESFGNTPPKALTLMINSAKGDYFYMNNSVETAIQCNIPMEVSLFKGSVSMPNLIQTKRLGMDNGQATFFIENLEFTDYIVYMYPIAALDITKTIPYINPTRIDNLRLDGNGNASTNFAQVHALRTENV